MREHERPPRLMRCGEMGEHDGLAAAGREHEQLSLILREPALDGLVRRDLIGAQGNFRRDVVIILGLGGCGCGWCRRCWFRRQPNGDLVALPAVEFLNGEAGAAGSTASMKPSA